MKPTLAQKSVKIDLITYRTLRKRARQEGRTLSGLVRLQTLAYESLKAFQPTA